MTTQVNIHEAKTHLSRLVDQAEHGETVIIARAGKPVVQITALPQSTVRLGGLRGMFSLPSDDEWEEMDEEIRGMFDPELEIQASRD
ncbi:type II toxin-antitoxin system Phd/YefM family antitoxin [Nocardioides sp. NPDC057577]|uniref:type II toxin-antitoxin system Phd/YefM family antitoxin n=1 Tax=unclassified Nocardioides TaxID=2615069 RepID=UPI00365BDDCE